MNNSQQLNAGQCDWFRLPFMIGGRLLTLQELNRHSDFRAGKGSPSIWTRKLSFNKEVLTIAIILDSGQHQLVFLKVSATELLVSCSAGTNQHRLSRHAYFALYWLMQSGNSYNFESFYWPGFFDPYSGKSKYLKEHRSKGYLVSVSLKMVYTGFYKPASRLPVVPSDELIEQDQLSIVRELPPEDGQPVLGFCLADHQYLTWKSDCHPFLIPYIGVLDKHKTAVKFFSAYVYGQNELAGRQLSPAQRQLVEICFAMKALARIDHSDQQEDLDSMLDRHERHTENYNKLFALWKQALPILAGSRYTHYHLGYGLRYLKNKPVKRRMWPCYFDPAPAQLCFLWKDRGEYYKLELRMRIDGQLHQIAYDQTLFFITSRDNPKHFFLASSVLEWKLLHFFRQHHYQLLMLKPHYQQYCKAFVLQLKAIYPFINR